MTKKSRKQKINIDKTFQKKWFTILSFVTIIFAAFILVKINYYPPELQVKILVADIVLFILATVGMVRSMKYADSYNKEYYEKYPERGPKETFGSSGDDAYSDITGLL